MVHSFEKVKQGRPPEGGKCRKKRGETKDIQVRVQNGKSLKVVGELGGVFLYLSPFLL